MPKLDGVGVVLDFIAGLPPKHAVQIVKRALRLSEDPFPPDSIELVGHPGVRRVDSGEYRIVYEYLAEHETVAFLIVGKRNDDEVYRRLRRMLE
jgi:mRNA interferase RelE/StbE